MTRVNFVLPRVEFSYEKVRHTFPRVENCAVRRNDRKRGGGGGKGSTVFASAIYIGTRKRRRGRPGKAHDDRGETERGERESESVRRSIIHNATRTRRYSCDSAASGITIEEQRGYNSQTDYSTREREGERRQTNNIISIRAKKKVEL